MATLSSIPETLDWAVYAGDNEAEVFQITGEQPVDLTGATIVAQARLRAKDPEVAAEAVIVLTDPTGGVFTVGWDGDVLRALVDSVTGDRWVGVWDLQVTTADGAVRTRVRGRFTVEYDVSREEEVA